MSRFARVTEEVYLRRRELADPVRKQGYQETFLLYQIILLHSWATGKSEKSLPELCELYNLEYHNTTRRLKILREKSWVEDTDKYIRPLLIHRPGKRSVDSTPNQGVKITPPSVKITPPECKNYTETDENSVNFTPENGETSPFITTYDDAKTSFKFKPDLENTSSSEKNGHKSEFSREECLRHVLLRIERGEHIPTPQKLANWLYQTGEHDVFIRAALYQAQGAEPEEDALTYEYDEAGMIMPKPLTARQRAEELNRLLEARAEGLDIDDFGRFFTPEDWSYMTGELDAHV